MIKQILTLMRGVSNSAADEFTGRHALTLLEQQMREAAQGVSTARKAVAIAVAQTRQEQIQHDALVKRIADLEQRTIIALKARQAGTCPRGSNLYCINGKRMRHFRGSTKTLCKRAWPPKNKCSSG